MRGSGDHRAEPPRVSLPALAVAFLTIGATSFGGALSGWMHREIVQRRRWLAEDDFLNGLALGQILPGTNVVNLSLYIGQRLRGGIGAITAVFAMLAPPIAILLALASLYERIAGIAWAHRFVEGVAAAAVGLTLMVGVRATRRVEPRMGSIAVLLATVVTVGLLRWPMAPVVLCLAPVSIAMAWPRKRGKDA